MVQCRILAAANCGQHIHRTVLRMRGGDLWVVLDLHIARLDFVIVVAFVLHQQVAPLMGPAPVGPDFACAH